jgi:hypothetical protein
MPSSAGPRRLNPPRSLGPSPDRSKSSDGERIQSEDIRRPGEERGRRLEKFRLHGYRLPVERKRGEISFGIFSAYFVPKRRKESTCRSRQHGKMPSNNLTFVKSFYGFSRARPAPQAGSAESVFFSKRSRLAISISDDGLASHRSRKSSETLFDRVVAMEEVIDGPAERRQVERLGKKMADSEPAQ